LVLNLNGIENKVQFTFTTENKERYDFLFHGHGHNLFTIGTGHRYKQAEKFIWNFRKLKLLFILNTLARDFMSMSSNTAGLTVISGVGIAATAPEAEVVPPELTSPFEGTFLALESGP
jgi:hypothetical protein